jgi:hypothetical protein
VPLQAEAEDDLADTVTDLGQGVLVDRAREREIPGEVPAVDDPGVDRHLDAVVLDSAEIEELDVGRAGGRVHVPLDQGVLGLLVEVGELEAHPVVEHGGVEAQLDLVGALGLEVRVAQVAEGHAGESHAAALARHRAVVPAARRWCPAAGPTRRRRARSRRVLRNDPC